MAVHTCTHSMVAWRKKLILLTVSVLTVFTGLKRTILMVSYSQIFSEFSLGRLRYKISYDHATQTLNVLVVECQVKVQINFSVSRIFPFFSGGLSCLEETVS
jgi:hypothetical protein